MHASNTEVQSALGELRHRVDAAQTRLQTRFHCGAYADSNLMGLFEELRTKILITGEESTTTFHPALSHDLKRNLYTLKIPKNRLSAHGDFKLVSYLLRAHANQCIEHLISDPTIRNNISWEFSDSVRFGSFIRFCQQLSDFKSIRSLHDYGLPVSQVLGFISRHHPGASLVSMYGLTKGYEECSHYHLKNHREIGRKRPHYSRLAWAHHTGRHDITAPWSQHFLHEQDDGSQTFLVTDPVWTSTAPASEEAHPIVAITRTVIWSNIRTNRSGFQNRLFDEPLQTRHIHQLH